MNLVQQDKSSERRWLPPVRRSGDLPRLLVHYAPFAVRQMQRASEPCSDSGEVASLHCANDESLSVACESITSVCTLCSRGRSQGGTIRSLARQIKLQRGHGALASG
jgi:hypothetical protein